MHETHTTDTYLSIDTGIHKREDCTYVLTICDFLPMYNISMAKVPLSDIIYISAGEINSKFLIQMMEYNSSRRNKRNVAKIK